MKRTKISNLLQTEAKRQEINVGAGFVPKEAANMYRLLHLTMVLLLIIFR